MSVAERIVLLIAFAALLSACGADNGRYPSLATRDVELRGDLFNVPPPPANVAQPELSADLTMRLSQLSQRVDAAHAKFLSVLPGARTAVARASGAPKGSPAWAEATVRISELDAARSQGMAALAELDMLRAQIAIESGLLRAVEDVWMRADATQSEENTVLQSLAGRLAR